MPNENKSVRASNVVARTCSGDMYDTVPSVWPGLVNSASAERVASSGTPLADGPDVAFGEPEIENLRAARREEDVRRLDVAMHDALAVRGIQLLNREQF